MGALANLLSRLLAVLALNRMKGRVKLLKESLALLASEPDVQLAHLRDLGVPDHVDELALEHDDIAPTAEKMLREGEINEDQLNCIKELDAILKGQGRGRTVVRVGSGRAGLEVRKDGRYRHEGGEVGVVFEAMVRGGPWGATAAQRTTSTAPFSLYTRGKS